MELQKNYRVLSIDLLRGVVMIIMALDHVRDYFHWSAQLYGPLDLAHTSIPIYFTRWITHFCAPIFMFLTGTSAYLVGMRKTKKQLSLFLFTRGLWLMFLEVTVVLFGWTFNVDFPFIMLITIWALGVSMIALSVLIFLRIEIILAIGILIVAGHDLFDNYHIAGQGLKAFIWDELHEPADFKFHGHIIVTGYPVLPWIGVITLGYCFGTFYRKIVDPETRKRWLLIMGSSAIAAFVLIRLTNGYGDPNGWNHQDTPVLTFLAFMKVSKYPPSLLYLLITLGPGVIFLAFTEKPLRGIGKFISTFGRVPMFYYILHIYLIHILAMLAAQLSGFGWRSMIVAPFPEIQGYGFPLWVVYVVWIFVVLLLYPLCKWYDRYKTNHKEKWWLSYL